jgi:hypothetical protein
MGANGAPPDARPCPFSAKPAALVMSALQGKPVHGHDAGALTRDDILDNITRYWLTNTGVSSARF